MDILWYSIITMGAESLSNSEGKGIGNKVKRGTFAVLVAVSSVGLGLSQKTSASPPSAEAFFNHDLALLQAAASKINSSDKFADVKVYDDKTIETKPGVFGKGYTFVGGYGGIIESKDKSTLLTYGYSFIRTPSGSYDSRYFGVTLYTGYPVGHPVNSNTLSLNDNQVYVFDLMQRDGGHLSCTRISGNPLVSGNSTASNSKAWITVGKALPSISSMIPFTEKQMSEMNRLVDQAVTVIRYGELGYVERATGVHNGVTTGGMFPPENPPKNID